MAKELSRTFDHALGAVVVRLQAEGGPVEVHTLYVAAPDFCSRCGGRRRVAVNGGRELDVEGEIAARLQEADLHRQAVVAGMRKAGWQG